MTELVLSLGKSTAQIFAQCSGVPGLAPAVQILIAIIETCEGVVYNRNAARCLRDRCHHLIVALHDLYASKTDLSLHHMLEEVETCLHQVGMKMDGWVKMSKLKGFTHQRAIAAEIEDSSVMVNDCLMKFNLASQKQIRSWQAEFAASAKHDHFELMESLSDIKLIQTNTERKLDENTELVRQMMKMMQELLFENKRSAEITHDGISKNLWHLQQQSGELMPDLHLKSGEVQRMGNQPIRCTYAMDIYEGLYLKKERVYIKCLRVVDANEDSLRRFKREVKIWAEVWKLDRGRHILPFYGFCQEDGPSPYMVSPWQKNGNMLDYVKAYDQKVDYIRLVKYIAHGIHFLHCVMKPSVVHGIIKAENVYVNDDGNPLLADFGISQIVTDISEIPLTQSFGLVNSYRWLAPEVCVGEGVLSTSSDIYAYGMTVLEIMTHQHPYYHIRHATEVVIKSSRGELPRRPTEPKVLGRGLHDDLWALLTQCWSQKQEGRPSIVAVLAHFRE